MIAMSLAEIASITGGVVDSADGSVLVTGAAFLDSRAPEPGGLFAAIAGEHVDGHDYVEGAVAGGAAAVLAQRSVGVPAVVVADVQTALQHLAHAVLERRRSLDADFTVIALTGSQGKTSTKDLLAAVLGDAAPTVATRGSFNNELGLPLTVTRLTQETRYLVLEMGARGIGHIAELCAIAAPDISVVLNVGTAHLGEFGSRENIAIAKGELVEACRPGGTAVLNADDDLVAAMARRTSERVLTFGAAGDVRLGDLTTDELGRPSFTLTVDNRSESVRLPLLGEHQARNAAAAAAAAIAAGVPLPSVAASLAAVNGLSHWRMELTERADGLRVLNDAYNANPDSMRAALTTLGKIADQGVPTVAVLGEMRELGETGPERHREIGRYAATMGIGALVVVGAEAAPIADGWQEVRESWDSPLRAADVHEATAWLRKNVTAPAVVLIKASRGVALERIATALLDEHR